MKKNGKDSLSTFLPLSGLIWTALLLLVIVSRMLFLSERPLHHDESLFAYYARQLALGKGYYFQPILHGPFLIDASAFLLRLLGEHIFVLRLVPALSCIGMVFLLYLLRDKLSHRGAIIAALLVAVSPTLMFYSRFMRNDLPFAFATLFSVWSMVRFWNERKGRQLIAFLLSLTWLLCIKENSLFYVATLCFFLIIAVLHDMALKFREDSKDTYSVTTQILRKGRMFNTLDLWISIKSLCVTLALGIALWNFYSVTLGNESILGEGKGVHRLFFLFLSFLYFAVYLCFRSNWESVGKEGVLKRLLSALGQHRWELLGGAMLSLSLIVLLFTTLLSVPKDIFTLFRDTFTYWWGQHTQHRIKGPFHYYLSLMIIYELPVLLIVLVGSLREICRKLNRIRIFIALWLLGYLLICLWLIVFQPTNQWLDNVLHMTSPLHIFLAFTCFLLAIVLSVFHLGQGKKFLAFVECWFFLSIIAYSYAGEKVPQGTTHILLPGILLAALYAEQLWQKTTSVLSRRVLAGIFGILILFNLRASIMLNFPEYRDPLTRLVYHETSSVPSYEDPIEQMVYNHTSSDIKEMARKIRAFSKVLDLNKEMDMYICDEAIWPLRWYLRDFDKIEKKPDLKKETPPVVILDPEEIRTYSDVFENYDIERKYIRLGWYATSVDFRGLWWALRPDKNAPQDYVKECAKYAWHYVFSYMLFRTPYPTREEIAKDRIPTLCYFGIRKDLAGLDIDHESP